MKKGLLLFFLMILTLILEAQKDTVAISGNLPQRDVIREATTINITIFPVPVKDNYFTIRAEKDISFVKITNIIGQDIYRSTFENQQSVKINLINPRRGMYVVTILFADGTRSVKKIMVEQTD